MIAGGDLLLCGDGDEEIASTRGALASLQEVLKDLTYKDNEQHVSILIGNETKQRRDHNANIAGDDPPSLGREDGAITPIRSTLASLRVIPHYHET